MWHEYPKTAAFFALAGLGFMIASASIDLTWLADTVLGPLFYGKHILNKWYASGQSWLYCGNYLAIANTLGWLANVINIFIWLMIGAGLSRLGRASQGGFSTARNFLKWLSTHLLFDELARIFSERFKDVDWKKIKIWQLLWLKILSWDLSQKKMLWLIFILSSLPFYYVPIFSLSVVAISYAEGRSVSIKKWVPLMILGGLLRAYLDAIIFFFVKEL